jgi:hypothetical protein
MRCLFCKINSDSSRSVEHIIPESLGGLSHCLPPGVVCDRCNNYFSREVEKPFLESAAIMLLRFHQEIPSKKGRVPPAQGIISPGFAPVTIQRHIGKPSGMSIHVPPNAIEQLLKAAKGMVILPTNADLPGGPVVSRFLAKVGLEAMAVRLVSHPDGLEYLVDETQLDALRNHARRGDTLQWPIHVRQIYDQDAKWSDKSGSDLQIVNEFDILVTDQSEWFFVLALFGLEMAINYGGPDIEGYPLWLAEHGNESPLYSGKNASDDRLRRLA